MITNDQVADLFAKANPVPNPVLEDDEPVEIGSMSPLSEETDPWAPLKFNEQATSNLARPLIAVALTMALIALAAVPLLFQAGERFVVPATPGELAVQSAEDLFAALTHGDVDGALMLMEPEARKADLNRNALAFFAALPGTKTLSDCSTHEFSDSITVSCTTNYNGPLMEATGEHSVGTFRFRDGLLTTMFTPGSRDEAAATFSEYASQVEPAAFDEACNPASYEAGSVRVQASGFAFAGSCGELWAHVADEAAAWIEEGKPPLAEK